MGGEATTGRICRRCNSFKQYSGFGVGIRKDGTHSWCKECVNAYKRDLYAKDPAAGVKRSSRWNAENYARYRENVRRSSQKPQVKEKQKKYRLDNKERYRVHDANKRAKRRSKASIAIPIGEWRSIVSACGGRCFYCWSKPASVEMDHFHPVILGGPHVASNIVPACRSCNARKHAKEPMEFMRMIGRA